MFVRILSLIRLVRVSRLVRFFNEVEKVSGEEPHSALETLSSSLGLSGCRYPEQLPGSGDIGASGPQTHSDLPPRSNVD